MTEQSPLERAARALASIDNFGDERNWQAYTKEARAVLMAIREPSDMMLANGHLAGAKFPWAVWEGMIDAALGEDIG